MSANWTWYSIFIRCAISIHSLRFTSVDTHKVYAILDEIFLAGEIEETSKDVVLSRLEALEKLE